MIDDVNKKNNELIYSFTKIKLTYIKAGNAADNNELLSGINIGLKYSLNVAPHRGLTIKYQLGKFKTNCKHNNEILIPSRP